jgi:putative transposase
LHGAGDQDPARAREWGTRAPAGVIAAGVEPGEIAMYLKGRSSRLLQQEFPHLKKRYWGQHLWARGYYCSTAGELTRAEIDEYISKHNEEDAGEQFTIDGE